MKVYPNPLDCDASAPQIQSELDDPVQKALIKAIEGGLPLTARPYALIGERLGICEAEVIGRIQLLFDNDLIKRMGVVVRHGQLGYKANAMVVWDIPDERVGEIALVQQPDPSDGGASSQVTPKPCRGVGSHVPVTVRPGG